MSLAFLAKKSWHTSNLKNVEKVWIAEQKHAAEEKKLGELKKQIEEERQLDELRELQGKPTSAGRVDWMYEGPLGSANKTEEYLLGKKFKMPQENNTSYGPAAAASSSNTTAAASSSVSDTFTRVHEDPMLMIKKRQQKASTDILKNPVKMKRIREQVQLDLKSKKSRKKAKKAAKKAAKKKSREAADSSVPSRDSRYGLSRAEYAVKDSVCTSTLGPKQEFVSKARDIRRKEEDRRQAEESRRKKKQPLSASEKQELLKEMMDDAQTRRRHKVLPKEIVGSDRTNNSHPEFLKSIRSQVYFDDKNKAKSLEDRISRNRHYVSKESSWKKE